MTAQQYDDLATLWMARGIAGLADDTPASLMAALACFEQAIHLREPLLASGNPWFRYNLAGSWLNRGDVLLRLAGTDNLAASLNACDRALELLRLLPVRDDPLFARRHALAWLNRGVVLLAQNAPEPLPKALRSFAEARRILDAPDAARIPAEELLSASVWANQADALARLDARDVARDHARRALALIAETEKRDPEAAVIGMKARHALCRSAAPLLAHPRGDAARETPIAEALAAAEDGLALARQWPENSRLQASARESFRFAAQACARRQPRFLAGFLRENPSFASAAANPESRLIAIQAVDTAFGLALADGFAALAAPPIGPTLALLRELRETAAGLRAPAGPAVRAAGYRSFA